MKNIILKFFALKKNLEDDLKNVLLKNTVLHNFIFCINLDMS